LNPVAFRLLNNGEKFESALGSRSFDSNFIPVIQLVTFSVEGRVLAAMQANGVSTSGFRRDG
jgi:hypothetical protein